MRNNSWAQNSISRLFTTRSSRAARFRSISWTPAFTAGSRLSQQNQPAPRVCSRYPRGWRCAQKSGETRPSPKVVATPLPRARTKYHRISTPATKTCRWGLRIYAATRRDGATSFSYSGPILSSLLASVTSYSALVVPKTEKNWHPAPRG